MYKFNIFENFINPSQILLNEPMKKHTYFKIGGNADCLIYATTIEQVRDVVKTCKANEIPLFVMGNGSNMLVSDDGIEGVVLKLSKGFDSAKADGLCISACSGILLSQLADVAHKNGLAGLEFASGIPGTLGGAVFMNAGAYGGEIKDVIKEVTVLTENGDLETYSADKMEFGYRTSIVQKKRLVIVNTLISLKQGDKDEIKAKIDELNLSRKEKQPLEFPSAGSTFKRPEGHFAGKLIMDSGLRGATIGGAQVSEKHCGFIVNKGNATAKDVMDLINFVKEEVYRNFGVKLEEEVKIVGRQ